MLILHLTEHCLQQQLHLNESHLLVNLLYQCLHLTVSEVVFFASIFTTLSALYPYFTSCPSIITKPHRSAKTEVKTPFIVCWHEADVSGRHGNAPRSQIILGSRGSEGFGKITLENYPTDTPKQHLCQRNLYHIPKGGPFQLIMDCPPPLYKLSYISTTPVGTYNCFCITSGFSL